MALVDTILKLTKQLYPTGRAFRMPKDGFFEKLHKGVAKSEARAYADAVSILDSALPDNNNFTTEDAAQWERRLGLITNSSVSLTDRKLAIRRKMQHPGTVKARQHYLYLQGQLQAAGFDVYVHENKFDFGAGFESIPPPNGAEVIANSIESPEGFVVGRISSWTLHNSGSNLNWTSVTYGANLFVAVASNGAGNNVMTSPDGATWTLHNAAADNSWTSVTYGNSLFVAVARTGSLRVMKSNDGVSWTSSSAAVNNSWRSVTFGAGLFVAVSSDGSGNRVMTSPDAVTWTSRTSAADNAWSSVTYGNGLFVAVSETGTVMTSPDGITWTLRTASSPSIWRSVTYGNGLFVAVSVLGTNGIMTSPDGINWTTRTEPVNADWINVSFGDNGQGGKLFVGTSSNGHVMISTDGITWRLNSIISSHAWNSVTYGGGKFVAVSTTDVITSTLHIPYRNTFFIGGEFGAPINLDNNTFTGSMTPWFNQGAEPLSWAYGSDAVSVSFGLSGSESKKLLEALDSSLVSGAALEGEIDIDPNVGAADVDIVLWDGVTFQVLDTIPVVNGVLATYQFNGIASINATHFGFATTRTDGLTSPTGIIVSRVTLTDTLPTANVPESRELEFRQLILKTKPVHMVGYLLINYT